MAITRSQSEYNKRAQGRFLDSAGSPAAAVLTLGFTPRAVVWENLTDSIKYEWFEGMAADTTVKTVLNGTRSLEVTNGITVDDGSGNQTGGSGTPGTGTSVITDDTKTQQVGESPSGLVTIDADIVIQNKQYTWVAIA